MPSDRGLYGRRLGPALFFVFGGHTMQKILWFVVLVLASFAARSQDAKPRVLDGQVVSATAFPTAAQFFNGPNFFCSGTLISSRHVLTGGHCVTDQNGVLNLTTNVTVVIGGASYTIARYAAHPTWNGTVGSQGVFDAAIVELSAAVPGITPSIINRTPLAFGDILRIVGFGSLGTGFTGTNGQLPPAGAVAFGDTAISNFGINSVYGWQNTLGDSNLGQGDSGGPTFLTTTGRVAGINSFNSGIENPPGSGLGLGQYGTNSGVTRIDAVTDFIDRIVRFTDLTSASVTLPAPGLLTVGQPYSTVCPVLNNGGIPTSPFNVRFHLSPDGLYRESDPLLGTVRFTNGLNPHSQATDTFTFTVPNVTGQFYVAWRIDADNEVFESDKTNNDFFNQTPATVAVNLPPSIVSGPTVTANPAFTGVPVIFSATATDPDGDTLGYGWDFGDGTTGTGASPLHVYLAAGTYTVTVAVDDGRGGTDSKSATITVVPEIPAMALQKKFGLNFRQFGRDTFDVTLSSSNFGTILKPITFGKTLDLFIGGGQADTATLFNGRGRSAFGTATWNFRQGTIRYQLRNTSLLPLLAPVGISNTTTSGTFKIPIFVRYQTVYYGGVFSFFYSASPGKSGKGL